MSARLLLLSPFFYPEPISTGKYNSHLVRALSRKGIEVDVLCFQPLYPDWRPRISNKKIKGVGIFRGGARLRYPKGSLLRRAVLEIWFFLHVFRHAGRIRRYSRIVAVLPPMLFLPMVSLASGPGCKVIAIVHDLQGIMAAASINRGRPAVLGLIRLLESLVLRYCHRVIALSETMAAFLSGPYRIPRSKLAVYRPFVTLGPQGAGTRLAHLFAEDKKHVVYAGGLGHKQCPERLVSFLHGLAQRRQDVVCHVFSGGPLFNVLRRDRRWKSERLVFHDLVPEPDLGELYRRSHVQIIPENKGLSAGAVPSKLPNLLAAGVPILYIGEKDGDIWKLILDCRAGTCCEGWDLDTLSALADQLLVDAGNRSHANRRQHFISKYADLFNVEALIKEILD